MGELVELLRGTRITVNIAVTISKQPDRDHLLGYSLNIVTWKTKGSTISKYFNRDVFAGFP